MSKGQMCGHEGRGRFVAAEAVGAETGPGPGTGAET